MSHQTLTSGTPTPGPKAIETGAIIGPHMPLGDRLARRDFLVKLHEQHKARVEEVTEVANGDWYTVWPDLSRVPEAPTVANIVEMGINHWTSIGGSVLPSIRVPTHTEGKKSQARRGARKRERRLRELWDTSNASELSALLWGDYAGAGSAIAGAWVNFDEPDPAKRNPYIMRFDPRHTYPVKDDNGNIKELLVARRISRGELNQILPPQWGSQFEDSEDEYIEEWFWFTDDRFYYALVDVSKDGRAKNRNVVLVDQENKLGFVPFWEATRPTFDGQRRGVFDQTLHILRTMHRLMMMTVYSTEENAFPAILEYDTVNADQFAPGAIIRARSADAKLDRISPTSHFDVKDLIARLGAEAQNAAVFPQQLQGEPGGSIVSARGVRASMGALDSRLALGHKQFEVLFGKISGFLLAMDEVYAAGEKTIMGDYRDDQPAESYDPAKDVNGAWSARATYGIAAGSDPANTEMRINMHLASGILSQETAREQLPFLDDPEAEPIKIFREQMQMALMQGILAMAGQGDPTMAAEALKLLDSDTDDFSAVLEKLVESLTAAPEEAMAPGGMGAEDAAMGAESLARGGVPGGAEDAPQPNLPPLGALLGGGPNQVM